MSKPIQLTVQGENYYPTPYFPIGFVYFSIIDINPNEHFLGTWKQLKDDAYFKIVTSKAGQCGGTSKDHKITIGSLPRHRPELAFCDYAVNGGGRTHAIPKNLTDEQNTVYDDWGVTYSGNDEPYYPYYYGIYAWVRVA